VAVDAAAVTLLAVRYAEGDLSAAGAKGTDPAVRRLTSLLRQHQEAIALVAAVRAGEVPAASAVDPLASPGPTEPRLFAGG
jgi:hypothetical protein